MIYSDENGDVKINVMLIDNDLWLTQDLIAELFGKDRTVITNKGEYKAKAVILATGVQSRKLNIENE